MIINENRLNLADPAHRKYLQEQVSNHFFGEGAEKIAGYTPPR
jgi:Fe-S cluster biosynthesis and repair protein YggX